MQRKSIRDRSRRGVVAAQVAISLTTLVGFMALSIDVGAMYNAKAELQRAADAAALAAASELGIDGSDMLERSRDVAQDFCVRNLVLGEPVMLDRNADVNFGQAYLTVAGKYSFEPTETAPNAVRVRVRRTEDAPSGAMGLFFARIFGIHTANLSAQATAVLSPRDIVFVLDLSGSHTDDSELMHYRMTEIANRPVWQHLWDPNQGPAPAGGGPRFGNLNTWGDDFTGPAWDFANDGGLVRLKRGTSWNLSSAWVSQTLSAKGLGTYNSAEMAVINNSVGAGTETSTSSSTQKANYRRRVRVALGLDRWKSGKPGGQAGGNGDNVIDANEVVSMVPYPSSSTNPATGSKKVGGSWDSFVDYVSDISKADTVTSNTGLSHNFLKYDPNQGNYGNPNLRWRFGLKTLVDYVLNQNPANSSSPGLAGSPQQPMGAVADAVKLSIDIIRELDGDDRVGLAAYGTVGYGPSDKPSNLSWLTNNFGLVQSKVDSLQAAMWTSYTNIAQGIDKGCEVFRNSPNPRPAAKFMFLLTDGRANQTRANPTVYYSDYQPIQPHPPSEDAKDAAQEARENGAGQAGGVRIFTISVGVAADQALMEQIAAIGDGEHFHAEGDISAYQQQLQEIFRKLGGRRPVELIE